MIQQIEKNDYFKNPAKMYKKEKDGTKYTVENIVTKQVTRI